MVVRLSTKGQVMIPKSIRDRYGWQPGTELEVLDQGGDILIRKTEATEFPETSLRDLAGCAGYEGPRRTLGEMEEATAEGARDLSRDPS